ncbi:MAG: GntR family transcriptional regulator [Eubacteriales bacterium]|nr:GntR family transcriptional regulator [Eubacteriales bacterium]
MLNINMQEHKPLRELVYEELRMLIMTGQIKPGTRMMEIDLAESMGVSRTPVREAIRQLEKDNLVTIEPRRGAYVSDISAKDMEDMLFVREPLEGLATYLAAQNMTDDGLEELKKVNARYEEAYNEGETESLIQLDTRFHNLITEGSGNKYLIAILKDLQEQVLRFRYIYFKSIRRAAEVIDEHRLILSSMIERDQDAAQKYSIEHIIKLRASIMREEDFHGQSERASE